MTFSQKYLDYEIRADFWLGAPPRFTCDEVFGGKSFDDPEKLTAAIDAYRLKLRKSFTNPIAWRIGGRYGQGSKLPQQVTVTSVTEDGKEAWIKSAADGRERVRLQSLYAEKDSLLRALEREAEAKAEIEAAWEGCLNWAPQYAPEDRP